MNEHNKNCPDCGTEPGELHNFGCDIERCPKCGHQLLSCGCYADLEDEDGAIDDDDIAGRMPWTGEWPGLENCRKLNLWCIWDGKWTPCDKDTPGASEDLNRLGTYHWDADKQEFIPHTDVLDN